MKNRNATLIIHLLTAGVLVLGGCKNEPSTPAEGTKTAPAITAQADEHAPADVTPGSHEDWCAEHQVPESQCTQCNPKLIAAFKATGDWCPEHGLPESQCRLCNPELKIQRPPKQEGAK